MKSLQITALAAIALLATGCATDNATTAANAVTAASDFATLRSDIAEVKALAQQANENAQLARQQAQENSMKINGVFRKSMRK